jgi:HlyD family secretion protein
LKVRRVKSAVKILKRFVTLAIVAGGSYYGWGYYQAQQAAEEEQSMGEVPTRSASVRDITVSVSATGTLQPVRIVQVKSKASGEILEMPVELGDRVEPGDLIAQVDTRTLIEELSQAGADLDSAQIRLSVAERDYERIKELHAEDLVSFRDLDAAEQSYTTAKGSLMRSEADVRIRQERLDDATVTASAAGTIIAKTVEIGTIIQSSTSSVQGGTTLVEMADLSTLEVRTLVDEIDIGQVKAGLPVNITVEAYPSQRFRGQVIKIEPQAVLSQQVTTFPVLTRIDNADGLLLPGMNADVEVIIHRRPQVLTVPNEAVKSMGDAGTVANLLGLPFDRDNISKGPTGAGAVSGEALADPAQVGGATEGATAEAGEGELDDGDIDFSKLRGMDAEEREEYMNGFTEDAQKRFRDSMSARFSGGGGGRGGGGGAPGGGRSGGGAPGGGGRSGGGAPGGGAPDGGGGGNTTGMDAFGIGRTEEAIVFVMDAEGMMTARQITIGVQDWEFTEVMAGLQDGDEVVILPSTSLLMSQEAMRDRFSRFSRLPGT